MNLTTRRTAASVAILAATALGALTAAPSQAVPILDPVGLMAHQPSPGLALVTPTHERPCFTWRSDWNESLDAPEPTCPLTPPH